MTVAARTCKTDLVQKLQHLNKVTKQGQLIDFSMFFRQNKFQGPPTDFELFFLLRNVAMLHLSNGFTFFVM
jgi:hypothetical protein